MPTNQDETLQQRYARDHQDYLKLCGSMTAEQVADLQLQLNNALAGEAALRNELAEVSSMRTLWAGSAKTLDERLTIAEQRNASIAGKVNKCKECGSDALFWFSHNTNHSCVQHNRLNTNDVTCMFVLGCAECSATLKTVSADTIAERMTAALKPTESGANEEPDGLITETEMGRLYP